MLDLPWLAPVERPANPQRRGLEFFRRRDRTKLCGSTAPFGDHDAWRAQPRKPSNGPRTQAARSGEL